MKKLLVLAIVVALSLSLVWAADDIKNTEQKADQSGKAVSQVKAPIAPGDVPVGSAIEKPAIKAETPQLMGGRAEDVVSPEIPVLGNPADKQEAELTQAEKEEASAKSQTIEQLLRQSYEETQAIQAQPAYEEPKWQPMYGEKGEITNPEPTINSVPDQGNPGLPPIITANLLTQTFHGTGWSLDNPAPLGAGWAVLDSGTEGTASWYVNDWHKVFYSATGWNDTVFASRFQAAYTESVEVDWLITPTIDLSEAVSCSLYMKQYYDNVSTTTDSANIMISTDNGATWARFQTYKADLTNPTRSGFNLNAYIGIDALKIGFLHRTLPGSSTTNTVGWVIDSVTAVVDGSPLWVQDVSGQMTGWFGDTPPAGPGGAWTILDSGVLPVGKLTNSNDWNRRVGNLGTDTVAACTYTSSNGRREWENEWIISPMFSIGASLACTLSMNEYWNFDFASGFFPPGGTTVNEHGYIKISETTDGGLTWGPWQIVADHNNVGLGSSNSLPVYRGQYPLTAWRGKDVRLGFQKVAPPEMSFATWYMSHLSVDDYLMYDHDAATAAVLTPAIGNSGAIPIKSRVGNVGTNTETFDDSTFFTHMALGTPILTEGFENGGAIPTGWTDSPGTFPWQYDGGLDHGPGAPHTGSYAAYFDIFTYAAGSKDSLISPSVDLSAGNYALSFWSWHSSGSDSVVVYLDDAGVKTRLYYLPATSAWTQNSIVLTSTSASAKIYFVGYSNFLTNNLYIDDVIISPYTIVRDYAAGLTITSMPALTVSDVTYASPLAGVTPGTYQVTQSTFLVGDENAANDTKTGSITVYAHTGTGGPDAAYYSWKDNTVVGGPTFSWIDMSAATPITFNSTDDGYAPMSYLGGSFYYYGTMYDSVQAFTNGHLSFTYKTATDLTNVGIPTAAAPNNIVAFMWDDLRLPSITSASVLNDVANNRFVIQYTDARFTSTVTDPTFDAQIIFDRDDSSIVMQYNDVQPGTQTDATIGIENATGTVGLQYFFDTNLGNYPWSGLAIKYYYVPPSRDIALMSILAPTGTIINDATFTPSVRLANNGAIAETFDLVFRMYADPAHSEEYNQTVSVVSLGAGIQDTIDFPSTSFDINGAYVCSTFVSWPGAPDPNPANDRLRSTFTVDQHYGEGGPDGGLYKWIDNTVEGGPTFSWIDMSTATYATFSGTDLGYTPPYYMGGTFYFYGVACDSAALSADGLVRLDRFTSSYTTNYGIPSASGANNMIAFMWDDMQVSSTGTGAMYLNDVANNRFIIQYDNIQFFGSPTTDTFDVQIILDRDDSTIVVQYNELGASMQTDATIGIENAAGSIGLQYFFDGSPLLNYPTEDLAIKYYIYTPTIDVATVSFDSPRGGYVGTPYFPTVTVRNTGSTAAAADVQVVITGPAPALDTVFNFTETTASIPAFTTQPFAFTTNSWSPGAGGSYAVRVTSTTAGDEIASNNTVTSSATIFNASTLDYFSDFEADNGGFLPTNEWEWGTPTYISGPPVDTIPSPTKLWGTDLDNTYDLTTLSTLYSPAVLLTGGTLYSADFWMWHYFESTYDGANLKISIDNGTTWSLLTTSVAYSGTLSSSFQNPMGGQSAWWGYRNWTHVTVDLTSYAGQTVLLKFDVGSDNSTNYAGLYVDNFSIKAINIDLAVNSIDAPSFIILPGSYTITAGLENLGPDPVTMDSVTFIVTDAVPSVVYYGKLVNQLFNSGPASFSSPTQWVASTGGNYTVTVTAYEVGDGVPSNNSYAELRAVEVPRAYPHEENLESLADWWIFYNGSGAGVYWTTSRSHSPTHSLYFYYLPYPREAWLVGPPVQITSAILPKFRFWEDQAFWGDDPDEVHGVMLMVDVFDFNTALDTLVIWDVTHVINGFAGLPQEFDMTPYIGHTVWPIMYYGTVSNGSNWYVDDIGIIETAVANIGIVPASISHLMETDVTNTYVADYTISNTGTAPLTWNSTNSLSWVAPSLETGTIPASGNQAVDLVINSTGIAQGVYNDNIVVTSNDPDQPSISLPVTITVSQVAPRVTTIDVTVNEGETQVVDLWIDNASAGTVHVTLTADQTPPPPPVWLSVAPPSADIAAHDSLFAQVTVDATLLTPGAYSGTITITSSNLVASLIVIPVAFNVMPVGCDYIPGDINGFGGANGVDIPYAITYLKGGTPPPDTCFDCPNEGDTLLAAMDVNGSCSANGIDVTFFVAFLKNIQPALLWCDACAPINPPVTSVPAVEAPGIKAKNVKAKSGIQ